MISKHHIRASNRFGFLPLVLVSIHCLTLVTQVNAQGEQEGPGSTEVYLNILVEAYKANTGDTIFGKVGLDDPEIQAKPLFNAKKYAEGIPYLDKLVARSPTEWNYFRRGFCHYRLKNYSSAIEDFTRSTKLHLAIFPDPVPLEIVGRSVKRNNET